MGFNPEETFSSRGCHASQNCHFISPNERERRSDRLLFHYVSKVASRGGVPGLSVAAPRSRGRCEPDEENDPPRSQHAEDRSTAFGQGRSRAAGVPALLAALHSDVPGVYPCGARCRSRVSAPPRSQGERVGVRGHRPWVRCPRGPH